MTSGWPACQTACSRGACSGQRCTAGPAIRPWRSNPSQYSQSHTCTGAEHQCPATSRRSQGSSAQTRPPVGHRSCRAKSAQRLHGACRRFPPTVRTFCIPRDGRGSYIDTYKTIWARTRGPAVVRVAATLAETGRRAQHSDNAPSHIARFLGQCCRE